jgi:hypothetical protein
MENMHPTFATKSSITPCWRKYVTPLGDETYTGGKAHQFPPISTQI